MRRKKKKQSFDHGVERASAPTRQRHPGPAPVLQTPVILSQGVSRNGMPYGLPQYTSVDEYGRVFEPEMKFAPQPNSAPVPIPTPSTMINLPTIVAHVDFVQKTPAGPNSEGEF